MRLKNLYIVLALLVVPVSLSLAGEKVSPDDPNIQYVGRVDYTDAKAPKITWPASEVNLKFEGVSLQVTLDDEKGKNRFNVFIDGDTEDPMLLEVEQGEKTYTLAEGLSEGTHTVSLHKRSEGSNGYTIVKGFELNDGATLFTPDALPAKKLEVFGDSISCGLGADAGLKPGKDYSEHGVNARNSYVAYSAVTARNLGCEYRCISRSGIGLVKSWWPTIMPQYYDMLNGNTDEGKGEKWDFSQWQPDYVVVNLFQNDSWIIKKPDQEQMIQAYVDFIKKLRGHYPKAKIFCTLGSMSANKTPWAGYVKQAVARMNEGGDKQVYAYIFATSTNSMHPKRKHHKRMAAELTAFIKSKEE